MIEPGSALRKGIWEALNDNLSYSGTNVPVFDSKIEGKPTMWVMMAGSRDVNASNKSRFVTVKDQDIEIYSLRNSTAQSDVLDVIASQILDILIPEVGTVGFSLEEPLSITFCRMEGASVDGVEEAAGNKFLHAKRITLRNRITQ